jgi:predicted ABC-type ATPase
VPIPKIISRYYKSIANVSVALLIADRGYVYDNSVADHDPKILFRARDGEIFKEYVDLKHHPWAQMMCDEVKALAD